MSRRAAKQQMPMRRKREREEAQFVFLNIFFFLARQSKREVANRRAQASAERKEISQE